MSVKVVMAGVVLNILVRLDEVSLRWVKGLHSTSLGGVSARFRERAELGERGCVFMSQRRNGQKAGAH